MTEDDTSCADLIAVLDCKTPPIAAEQGLASLQELRSILADAGLAEATGCSIVAEGLTAESQSFVGMRSSGRPEGREAPRDEFAARLTAAFASGALDLRTRGFLATAGQRTGALGRAVRQDETPPPYPRRTLSAAAHELNRQKYAPVGMPARSLYPSW